LKAKSLIDFRKLGGNIKLEADRDVQYSPAARVAGFDEALTQGLPSCMFVNSKANCNVSQSCEVKLVPVVAFVNGCLVGTPTNSSQASNMAGESLGNRIEESTRTLPERELRWRQGIQLQLKYCHRRIRHQRTESRPSWALQN